MTTADTAVHSRARLNSLTSLRFAAALLVVLNHLTRDGGELPVVTHLFTSGTAGVGFFFALSGFVLTWSSRPGDPARRFYRRRFARIYPLHFLTFLIGIAVLMYVGSLINHTELLASPTMLSAWFPEPQVYFGMNAPSWSLSDETLFYALFPVVAVLVRRMNSRLLWIVLASLAVLYFALAVAITPHVNATYWLYVFPPFRLFEFVAGCCAAQLVANGFRLRLPLVPTIALAVVAYVCTDEFQYLVRPIGHGVEDAVLLPFILLLLFVGATSDIDERNPWLRTPALVKLGEWSFALYLTHWLLLETLVHLIPEWRQLPGVGRGAADVAFIVLAVGVAALAFTVIEKPMERRLRGQRVASVPGAGTP